MAIFASGVRDGAREIARHELKPKFSSCLHLTKFHYYVIFISQAFVAGASLFALLIRTAYLMSGNS